MKQKQVKASPKVARKTRAIKKATPAKNSRVQPVESDDDEDIVQEKVVVKKTPAKKAAKIQQKFVVEPSDDENEELDEDEQEDDEEEVVQVKNVSKKPLIIKGSKVQKQIVENSDDEKPEEDEEDENDDQEDEDQEEDDEDQEQDGEVEEDAEASEEDGEEENEQEEEEAEDDNDEAPSEEAIDKEEPTIPSKVKSGPIPETVPVERVIYVTKLPKKCNKINIVETFAKYGAIEQIHILTTSNGTTANIAYKTEKAALAAAADDKKVRVVDSLVWIKMKKQKHYNDRDRCVHVKHIRNGTSDEEIIQHFESCGEIEKVKLVPRPIGGGYAFVTFTDKSAVPAALKLHNSVLHGVNVKVTENTGKQNKTGRNVNEHLTVLVKNKQNFENIDPAKLEAIFSKCGEIDVMDIVCSRNVLAFITFKTEVGVEKALKLAGKTEEEIELDLELYNPIKRWTSIHVSNLPRNCTEEDLTNIFSKAGEIASITLKSGYAIIRFIDSEGYCKSFLYNETFIKGQHIFIAPHSFRKTGLKSKSFQKKGFKRPAQNGYSVFKPKKAKNF